MLRNDSTQRNRARLSRRIIIVGLFLAGTCACRAEPSLLKEMAEAQQELSAKAAEAHRAGEVDGLGWKYFELKAPNLRLEFRPADYEHPAVLVLPARLGSETDRAALSAIDGNEETPVGRLGSRAHVFYRIPKQLMKSEKLSVEFSRHPHFVWIGEEASLRELWDDCLEPYSMIYRREWLPLTEQYGLSPTEQFNELKLMNGRAFATTPKAAAGLYAAGCVTGLKFKARQRAEKAMSWADAEAVRKLYHQDGVLAELEVAVRGLNADNLRLALEDMNRKFPGRGLRKRYGLGLEGIADERSAALAKLAAGDDDAASAAKSLLAECRDIMLANPLLDDMQLVAVRRKIGSLDLRDHNLSLTGLDRPPRSGFGSCGRVLGIPKLATHSILTNLRTENQWNCDIVKLSGLREKVEVTPLYRAPEANLLISNAHVHWDGNRIAFTMGSHEEEMTLYELDAASGSTQRLSPETSDHFVDSCYLPDGNMVVMSTAIMTALACEGGSHLLSNMYLLNPETGKLRQLGVDQENSYHATVTDDGKVMYIRYEYTDTPHYFTRIVMEMNPDGTNQREIYGSNSVWPTSVYYPQPIPGNSKQFSAVVSGHHGPSHMGRLVLFDVSRGRREADGAVQFIGDRDQPVEAVMVDRLYAQDFPKHMYSVPLDEAYYLTMMKPSLYAAWGLYLVDRFDNKTLIYEPEEEFIAWPQIMNKKELPPVIPSSIDESSKTSTLYVQDLYEGPGLAGVPRGSVKDLAVYAFHYGYRGAASHKYIGIESSWDARYILGTVPVNEDGSVAFEVPAMMPVSLMPLDAEGRALQKMRTWINPQPGEYLSCVGCHEAVDHTPLSKTAMASNAKPQELKPWLGPARVYSFVMEMQPVLDRYCVSCHDGSGSPPDLRNDYSKEDLLGSKEYSQPYTTLQKYVRRSGPESDYRLTTPTEWHASSSTLVQMLEKGHYGVALDDEAWRRLYMWIDLNVPFHGSFHPGPFGEYGDQAQWRADALRRYAGLDWNAEAEYVRQVEAFVAGQEAAEPITPKAPEPPKTPTPEGWPFPEERARQMQDADVLVLEFGKPGRTIAGYDRCRAVTRTLPDKERLEFVRIPAGRFVMGDDDNYPNETPRVVEIKRPFWMSTSEIANSQFQAFAPEHDSGHADLPEKDQTSRGVPLYTEKQPAVRVSHRQAVAFCEWLSRETGEKVSLPTEEQWEWAARAGTDSDMWFGERTADFGTFANLSDFSHRYSRDFTRRDAPDYFCFIEDVDDGQAVSASIRSFQPNPWGLYDMIGNVEEWTATPDGMGKFMVRGGSWFDVPRSATSAVRWGYNEFMRLPDLGFRVIIEE